MDEYCQKCGHKTNLKQVPAEGMVPYCDACQEFRYPLFALAISTILLNPKQDKILMIKQYQRDSFILVAGYVNYGEEPELTVAREVMEETGLNVTGIEYLASEFYENSKTLMLNFVATATKEDFKLKQDEVDFAQWIDLAKSSTTIRQGSLAQKFLNNYLNKTGIS